MRPSDLLQRGRPPRIKGHLAEKLEVLRTRARPLTPELVSSRRELEIGRYGTRARLNVLLLSELMGAREKGGGAWIGRVIEGE